MTDFEVTGVTDDNFEEVKPPFQKGYTNATGIPKERLFLKLIMDNSRRELSEAIVRVEAKVDSEEDADEMRNHINGIESIHQ